jgi:hypothetical protein
MHHAFRTSMARTHGTGLDGPGLREDVRSFLAWWDRNSHEPLQGADTPKSATADHRMAA